MPRYKSFSKQHIFLVGTNIYISILLFAESVTSDKCTMQIYMEEVLWIRVWNLYESFDDYGYSECYMCVIMYCKGVCNLRSKHESNFWCFGYQNTCCLHFKLGYVIWNLVADSRKRDLWIYCFVSTLHFLWRFCTCVGCKPTHYNTAAWYMLIPCVMECRFPPVISYWRC